MACRNHKKDSLEYIPEYRHRSQIPKMDIK